MCGLAGGASSYLVETELDVIGDLTLLNMYRGSHSTGMFDFVSQDKLKSLPKSGKESVLFWKTTQHPISFANGVFRDAFKDRWVKANPKAVAVHTRFATTGKINKENSHPFHHGNIIGMHNGTITGQFKNRDKFDTDSEALIFNINKLGFENAINEVQNCSPAYALVWMDISKDMLYFYRNDKRPLHFARSGTNGITVYWSSEKETLEFALHVNKITGMDIKPFLVDTLYSLDLSKGGLDIKINPFVPKRPSYSVGSTHGVKKESSYPYTEWSSAAPPAHNSAYHETWGQATQDITHCRFDEPTQKWFPVWRYEQLLEAREREAKEAAEEAFKDVPPFTPLLPRMPPGDNLNDPLPDLKQSGQTQIGNNTSSVVTPLANDFKAERWNKETQKWEVWDDDIAAWRPDNGSQEPPPDPEEDTEDAEELAAKLVVETLSAHAKMSKADRRRLRKARAIISKAKKRRANDLKQLAKPTAAIKSTEQAEQLIFIVNNDFVTETTFKHATHSGCGWCGDPTDEKERLLWLRDKNGKITFLCEECLEKVEDADDHDIHSWFPKYNIADALKQREQFEQLCEVPTNVSCN